MANHGTAALVLVASLLVAVVALSGADARQLSAEEALRGARVVTVRPVVAEGGYTVLEKEKAKAPPAPQLACSKVHGVQKGETCSSVAEGSGLGQDDFLAFNPNINCEELFVGQWVCLKANAA